MVFPYKNGTRPPTPDWRQPGREDGSPLGPERQRSAGKRGSCAGVALRITLVWWTAGVKCRPGQAVKLVTPACVGFAFKDFFCVCDAFCAGAGRFVQGVGNTQVLVFADAQGVVGQDFHAVYV